MNIATIKTTLFTNWTFMRWFRFVLAIMIAIQAVQMHDLFSGAVAAFFLFQSLTNTGCCGSQGCALPSKNNIEQNNDEPSFEEIKAPEKKSRN
ncbi:MAG: hypothetical protein WCR21_03115 [Bacteroidota bacterium]